MNRRSARSGDVTRAGTAAFSDFAPALSFGLNVAPGSGEAISALEYNRSVRELLDSVQDPNSRTIDTAARGADVLTNALGTLPLAGAIVRGIKGATNIGGGMLREFNQGRNELVDANLKKELGGTKEAFQNSANETLGRTGVYLDEDNFFKQEIADNLAKFKNIDLEKLYQAPSLNPFATRTHKVKKLSEIFEHPEFFASYPELDQPVRIVNNQQDWYGSTGHAGLELNLRQIRDTSPEQMIKDGYDPKIAYGSTEDRLKSVMLHELQHEVQKIEGFAEGGAPATVKFLRPHLDPDEGYHRLLGENESKATQNRMDLDLLQRRERPIQRDYPTKQETGEVIPWRLLSSKKEIKGEYRPDPARPLGTGLWNTEPPKKIWPWK